MEYRVNRRTGDRISVLGVGTSGLPAAGAKEGAATLEICLLYTSPSPRDA